MHRGDIISKSGAAIDAAAGNEQRVVYREHNMPQLSRTTVAQHQIRLDSRIGFTSGARQDVISPAANASQSSATLDSP